MKSCVSLRDTDERIASMIQSNFGIEYNKRKVQYVKRAFGIRKYQRSNTKV